MKKGRHQVRHVRTTKKGKKFFAGKGAKRKFEPFVEDLKRLHVPEPSGDPRIRKYKKVKKIGIYKDEEGLYNLTLPYTGYRVDLIDAYDNALHDYDLSDDGKVITLKSKTKGLLNKIKKSVSSFAKFKREADSHKSTNTFEKSAVLNRVMNTTKWKDSKGNFIGGGNTNLKKSYDQEHKPTLYYDRLNKLKEKESDNFLKKKLKPLTKKVKYKKIRKDVFHPHINK